MNIIHVLGGAIAESVGSVGTAFQLFSTGASRGATPRQQAGWLEQFSEASLDQRAARRTVNALYRGATVRI